MSTFQLEIITPEAIAYTDMVDMVVVPSQMGNLGILHHHIPLFAALTHGELKIKKGNEEYFLAIGGGYVEVTKEKVMILVTRAVKSTQLNESEILRAKKEAQEALKQKPTGDALVSAQTLLRQSLTDWKLLQRRKKGMTH